MVRQAGKGLDADDIRDSFPDEFEHFSGEEPALAGLVAVGNDGGSRFGEFRYIGRRRKMLALLEFL